MRVELGQIVKDKITTFEGVAVGAAEYLTGCRKVCVQPQSLNGKDGQPTEALWFDESRLEVLPAQPFVIPPAEVAASGPGNDFPDAPRA